MNATPATLAQQVKIARRVNRPALHPVYTTTTGDLPTDLRTGQRLVEQKRPVFEMPKHTLSGYSDECACEKWADCYYCGACTPDE